MRHRDRTRNDVKGDKERQKKWKTNSGEKKQDWQEGCLAKGWKYLVTISHRSQYFSMLRRWEGNVKASMLFRHDTFFSFLYWGSKSHTDTEMHLYPKKNPAICLSNHILSEAEATHNPGKGTIELDRIVFTFYGMIKWLWTWRQRNVVWTTVCKNSTLKHIFL